MNETDRIWNRIGGLLLTASVDELLAFEVIASKVMSKGRESYGATDLATDTRDFRREAADEIVDTIWYWALDEVRRQLVLGTDSSPGVSDISAPPVASQDTGTDFDDEVTGRFDVSDVERTP